MTKSSNSVKSNTMRMHLKSNTKPQSRHNNFRMTTPGTNFRSDAPRISCEGLGDEEKI